MVRALFDRTVKRFVKDFAEGGGADTFGWWRGRGGWCRRGRGVGGCLWFGHGGVVGGRGEATRRGCGGVGARLGLHWRRVRADGRVIGHD